MKKIFLLIPLFIAVQGCGIIFHDEDKARLEADKFVYEIYFEKDYNKTKQMLFEGAGTGFTESIYKTILDKLDSYGGLKSIKAIEFVPVNGQRAIQIIYEAQHESNRSYHRIYMVGDGIKGYKAAGIFVADKDFPELSPKYAFRKEVKTIKK